MSFATSGRGPQPNYERKVVTMRVVLSSLLVLSLHATSAFADAKAPTKVAAAPGKTAAAPPKKEENLDEILQQAASAGEPAVEKQPEPAKVDPAKVDPAKAGTAKAPADAAKAGAAKPQEKVDEKKAAAATATAKDAKPAEPAAPLTDDNDTSAEAAKPAVLAAVQQTGETRRRGPYDLGPLDCRVLDGAGIERLLPPRIVAGEEPDILCRVVVTQPANVLTTEHDVTLSVTVGPKETFRQTRRVRIGSVGRRAMVFVIPADKISSDDAAQVKLHALLSAPATPGGGREVKFTVETED